MELMLIGVEGAFTEALQLESPEALAAIRSPVTVSGQSTAFEAVVNVEIREDGTIDPLVETTVMGGSMGQLGPFSEAIDFPAPTASAGAIVLMTPLSGERSGLGGQRPACGILNRRTLIEGAPRWR
jgi:hypothetical protein